MNKEIQELNKKAESYASELKSVSAEIATVVVGQKKVVDRLLIGLLCGGHILVEGVPGLAKTLTIKTLADCLSCQFVRLQFTPDLLPADITGTKIYDHNTSNFKTIKGPLFTNFVLADEINRAPPKVQSALLEAMQERQVSIQGETLPLPSPFLVLATQNPIESEGTYKLPEAQLDRFMFKVLISYPSKEEEVEIMSRFTQGESHQTKKILSSKQVLSMQSFVSHIYADDKILEYAASLVDATRHSSTYKLDLDHHVEHGASPRASLWLVLAAKAHALLHARGYVKPEDVQAITADVLRHRILLSYEAEADQVTTDSIIEQILSTVPVP